MAGNNRTTHISPLKNKHQLADHILKAYSPQQEENTGAPVHRTHFLKTAWFRYAATILLLLSVGAYFWFRAPDPKPDTATIKPATAPADIAPGGNKAELMLADGSRIVLDSAANGHLASQGNTQVVKLGQRTTGLFLRQRAGNPGSDLQYA